MTRFVPDHIKTKTMCKHAFQKFLFVIRYVPDRCKTQRMCDKAAVMENVPSFHVKYRNTGKFKFIFFNSFLIV